MLHRAIDTGGPGSLADDQQERAAVSRLRGPGQSRDGGEFVMQDHQLFSAQGQAGISAAIVVTKFDLENGGRQRLNDGTNLPSA